MKYHKQRLLNDSYGGGKGSCYPTALACLLDLDLDQVPHFNLLYFNDEEVNNITKTYRVKYLNGLDISEASDTQNSNYEKQRSLSLSLWDVLCRTFLASRGYIEQFISKDDADKWLKNNQDKLYMKTGMSSRGVLHVAIYKNDELVHDPHPSNDGVQDGHHTPISYLEKIK